MLTLYLSPVKSTLWQNLLKTKKSPKKIPIGPGNNSSYTPSLFSPIFCKQMFFIFWHRVPCTVYRQKTLNDPSKQKANKLNSAEHYRRVEGYGAGGLTHVKITLVME